MYVVDRFWLKEAFYIIIIILFIICREIRECLKLDPDHKLCFPHYKVSELSTTGVISTSQVLNILIFLECEEAGKKATDHFRNDGRKTVGFVVVVVVVVVGRGRRGRGFLGSVASSGLFGLEDYLMFMFRYEELHLKYV